MVPPSSLQIPRVCRYSGYDAPCSCFIYGTITRSGWLSHTIRLHLHIRYVVLTPIPFPASVWPPPISLATTFGISFDFFSSPYLDVSVREVPFIHLLIQCTIIMLHMMGFPHSDTCGSKLICSSPQLFAAYRVLLRLPMPRHSPYALFSLNFMSFANLFLRSKCFL